MKITLYEGSSFCGGEGYLPDMALFALDTDTRVGRDLLLDCVPTFVDSLPLDQPRANISFGGEVEFQTKWTFWWTIFELWRID